VPPFEFCSAGRVVFGRGEALRRVPPFVAELGCISALLVTGSSSARAQPLAAALTAAGVSVTFFALAGPGEPTVDDCEACLAVARAARVDCVIGFGGGSAVDTGKAVAALLTQPEGLLAYMEVVGEGKPLVARPLPYVAVPTTAGTGSEVTKNSVFDAPAAGVKASIRSQWMLPALSVVDPGLTDSVPPAVTAATGLDALTQCLEPYVCNAPNPLTDALCLEGLRRAARSLRAACVGGAGAAGARDDMCVTSLFGGLALANAKLGAVHGFAGPLGGMLKGAPHGALCAAMLPHACAENVSALAAAAEAGDAAAAAALARFDDVACALTGRPGAAAAEGVAWLQAVCAELAVPGLASYGLGEARFAEAIEKGRRSSSMKGNPVALSDEQLARILARAL
jgi:alcohol dehydrogenase class IV